MSNFSSKATAAQVEAAVEISQQIQKLKEIALRADLRFLGYLLDMAYDEAAAIARGKRDQAESAATLAHKD
jgi:hypothetical protein